MTEEELRNEIDAEFAAEDEAAMIEEAEAAGGSQTAGEEVDETADDGVKGPALPSIQALSRRDAEMGSVVSHLAGEVGVQGGEYSSQLALPSLPS